MTAVTWRNRFFLPEEISVHNALNDCWVTIYGVVKDVTGLLAEYDDPDELVPILREAGQDVSYWFEMDETGALVVSKSQPSPLSLCARDTSIIYITFFPVKIALLIGIKKIKAVFAAIIERNRQ